MNIQADQIFQAIETLSGLPGAAEVTVVMDTGQPGTAIPKHERTRYFRAGQTPADLEVPADTRSASISVEGTAPAGSADNPVELLASLGERVGADLSAARVVGFRMDTEGVRYVVRRDFVLPPPAAPAPAELSDLVGSATPA